MTRNLKEFVNHKAVLDTRRDFVGLEHVSILLAHYNGAALLSDQLESLASQTHRDWSLIISDDGSSDGWLSVARDFAASYPDRQTLLSNGPRRGFAQNFLSLVEFAGPTVPFAAYCDQDDVWLPDKLERAIKALRSIPSGQPALYCGRTMVCDRALRPIGPSPLFRRAPDFANALVQNIGGGNTMVLNRPALDLLQDTRHHAGAIVSHDWWTYQLIAGAGGKVIYDPEPTLLYRQHPGNMIGANASFPARLSRLRRMLTGEFRGWNDANCSALRRAAHWLTPEARVTLDCFQSSRNGKFGARLRALHDAGIYRQTTRGQIALWIAAALKKL